MTDALTHARDDLIRVQEESRKAASYLAVSQAVFHVPNFAGRWSKSDSQWAMDYCQKATHMAFAVTLAATLEEKSGGNIVSIPRLVKKLKEPSLRSLVAQDRRIQIEVVNTQANRAVAKFDLLKNLPIYDSLKRLRHNVIAHHNSVVDHHGATQGALKRLMIGTLVLVDRIAIALNGEPTDTRDLVAYVRRTAVEFWEYGIDGYPWHKDEEENSASSK